MTNMLWTLIVAQTNMLSAGMVDAAGIEGVGLAAGGRMSRPVETICVVTNVTATDNGKPGCPYWRGGCLVLGCAGNKPEPATEKTETTDVVEVRTLRFHWNGEACALKRERPLERKVRKWVRKEDWVEEGKR